MANVKILRLSSGDDVVAEVVEQSDKLTKVKQPFSIVPMQEAPGKPVRLVLTPYIPYGDCSEVNIKSANIVAEVEPMIDIKNNYNEQTGAGVVEVPKPQLIT
tara:strand:- start:1706 stop:2011 length:306 start_codon:yes stop_codon:yes gene_type:complete